MIREPAGPGSRAPLLGVVATLSCLALLACAFCFSLIHLDFPRLDPLGALVSVVWGLIVAIALLMLGGAAWLYRLVRGGRRGWPSGLALLAALLLFGLAAWPEP